MRVYDGETYWASRASNSSPRGPGRWVRTSGTVRSSNSHMGTPSLHWFSLPRLVHVSSPRTPSEREVGKLGNRPVETQHAIETEDHRIVWVQVIPAVEELPHPIRGVVANEQDRPAALHDVTE